MEDSVGYFIQLSLLLLLFARKLFLFIVLYRLSHCVLARRIGPAAIVQLNVYLLIHLLSFFLFVGDGDAVFVDLEAASFSLVGAE